MLIFCQVCWPGVVVHSGWWRIVTMCVCLSGRTRPPVSPQEQGCNFRQGGEGGRHEPVSRSGRGEDLLLGVGGENWELVSCCRFWRRLSRCMSKINPEPNLIHIMGCYVLGNPNGEKVRPSSMLAPDQQTSRPPDSASSLFFSNSSSRSSRTWWGLFLWSLSRRWSSQLRVGLPADSQINELVN